MKKELAELKKQFSPENCAITRIRGYLVNGEKEIESEFNVPFLNLPEEEMFKYFDIFRKALSGKQGKTMHNLTFTDRQKQEYLRWICKNRLKEDADISAFIDSLIQNRKSIEKFLLTIIHVAYDVPGKTTDNEENFDASEIVHEFNLYCICPVTLSKPYLCASGSRIEDGERNWIVNLPDTAFMYPAFTERETDYERIWYYTKSAKTLENQIIEETLGCEVPPTFKETQENFTQSISIVEESIDFPKAKEIFNYLIDITFNEEQTDRPTSKKIIESILKKVGYSEETAGKSIKNLQERLLVKNVVDSKHIKMELPNVAKIKVDTMYSDKIDVIHRDGKNYLTLEIPGELYMNDVRVKLEEEC